MARLPASIPDLVAQFGPHLNREPAGGWTTRGEPDRLVPLAKKYGVVVRPMLYPGTQQDTYNLVKRYKDDIKIWEIGNEQDAPKAGAQDRINAGKRVRFADVYAVLSVSDLYDPDAPDAKRVVLIVNSWVQLTMVLNELARSMGQHDFYPFVMSRQVLRKLHFIQMIVKEARGGYSII
jgi:hypothetical protein